MIQIEVKRSLTGVELDQVVFWLRESYWAMNRPHEVEAKAVQNSLNFLARADGQFVGFARIVTDHATFAWLCDVIVDPNHRGSGIGKALVEAVVGHPDLHGIRRMILGTRDAHTLYSRYGFEESTLMVRRRDDPPLEP